MSCMKFMGRNNLPIKEKREFPSWRNPSFLNDHCKFLYTYLSELNTAQINGQPNYKTLELLNTSLF